MMNISCLLLNITSMVFRRQREKMAYLSFMIILLACLLVDVRAATNCSYITEFDLIDCSAKESIHIVGEQFRRGFRKMPNLLYLKDLISFFDSLVDPLRIMLKSAVGLFCNNHRSMKILSKDFAL